MLTLLIVVIVIALLFDLVNGFHDAANSIATVVSTKVLTPFQAVVWAAAFNILAFWVFDMSVGNTVAKTVDANAIDLWVILAGLLAATFWNLLTWWLGIPSSSSHTLIGGFAGAAVAHAGFGVIASADILIVIAFIFLAPIIGGIISYLFTLITISRNFWAKIGVLTGVTIGIYFIMDYMIYHIDMKPIMMYVVLSMLGIFILSHIIFEIRNGKKPSALKEARMHKRMQLLSSAAFSLGHGGADSQKVMGIICAALMVYDNAGREQGFDHEIPKYLQVSEVVQIEYYDQDGKIKKVKPEIAEMKDATFYVDGDNVIDLATGEVAFKKEEPVAAYSKHSLFPEYKAVDKKLKHLQIYTKGKLVMDSHTNDTIFNNKTLNKNYDKAVLFADVIQQGAYELKEGYKIKTKVKSESMPFWIAFGCYFMIGIGTLMGGWKIVKTMGTKITKVTPLEGVCAETAGALTLFTVSQFGIPVSTTHTITGSIIGVGATKRLSAVRWGVTINLLWAWILTIPVSAALAAIFLWIIKLFV